MELIREKRAIFATLAAVLAVLSAGFILWRCTAGSYGHVYLRAVDAYTLAPVAGVRVILPESGLSAVTDSMGGAYLTGIPIAKNPFCQRHVEQGWGECTMIALHDDYIPYALFYMHVYENRVQRPVLYLFPVDSEEARVTAVIESPDEDWILELIDAVSD